MPSRASRIWAIKDRQKKTAVDITPPINSSFDSLVNCFKLMPPT